MEQQKKSRRKKKRKRKTFGARVNGGADAGHFFFLPSSDRKGVGEKVGWGKHLVFLQYGMLCVPYA
jgi:hypothetical protein